VNLLRFADLDIYRDTGFLLLIYYLIFGVNTILKMIVDKVWEY